MITPTTDKVIIRRLNTPRKYGEIYSPDEGVRLSDEGIVVAHGPGDHDKKGRLQPLDVTVGDHILFKTHTASAIQIDDQEFWSLRERDIIAVIER